MQIRLSLILVLMLILAACGGANPDAEIAELPTVAVLPTSTATLEPSVTPHETWTLTPTATVTVTPSQQASATVTASQTITDTPSPTFTFEPTVTLQDRPITGLLELAQQATILPQDFVVPDYDGIEIPLEAVAAGASGDLVDEPTPAGFVFSGSDGDCALNSSHQFSTLYSNNPAIASELGCPFGTTTEAETILGAWQSFENGYMIWLNDGSNAIHVLRESGDNAIWQQYADTFVEDVDPEFYDPAPSGLHSPIRGFGKIWANNAPVSDDLGWGTSIETGDPQALLQDFSNGKMIYFPTYGNVIILIAATEGDSTWEITDADF